MYIKWHYFQLKIRMRLFTIIFFISLNSFAQNVFDATHTRKYANYLMASGQYDLASKEFERMYFFDTKDDTLKANLMRTYRLSKKADLAYQKVKVLYPDSLAMPWISALEYSKVLFTLEKWEKGSEFWNSIPSFKKEDAAIFEITKNVYTNKLELARNVLKSQAFPANPIWQEYSTVLAKSQKSKKPVLAGLLSAIVPGLGKIYAKDWKDGLLTFVFTGSMAFQSYRSFNKHGFKDARGYIYGAIGSGFYLGSIYGSTQSAKNYNLKQIDQTKHEISAIFNANY
jgi:TM2 domain-containing membrane protein YozV